METLLRRPKILLCCTGSVAACRVPEIALQLRQRLNAIVRIAGTSKAFFFMTTSKYDSQELDNCEADAIYKDEDEWKWKNFGDPILHIELKKWADICLIAPLDANTLAKIANGLADNLVTNVLRAWEIGKKPIVYALAMNSTMILHPVTEVHTKTLNSWGFIEVPTVSKMLACGDVGPGGIANTEDVVLTVSRALQCPISK